MSEKVLTEFIIQKLEIDQVSFNRESIATSSRFVWIRYCAKSVQSSSYTGLFLLKNPRISSCKNFVEEDVVKKTEDSVILGFTRTVLTEKQKRFLSQKQSLCNLSDLLEKKLIEQKPESIFLDTKKVYLT